VSAAPKIASVAPKEASAGAPRGRFVVDAVDKRFERGGYVLRDVSLTCEPGELVVVVGPSGCGKSTLLNIAAGMLGADRGEVTLDGQPVRAPGPERTMVFQEHGLFPWLSAAQNIELGLKMAGVSRSERLDRVASALRMVHLTSAGDKLVHELSGGMRQRIAIARALVLDPALLLMDEPFAALDAQTRTLLHEQLQEVWLTTRKTILFVTHSVGEAVRLADRIVVMSAYPGRIRRVIDVPLPSPRPFDTPTLAGIAREVREEIEDEVNRLRAEMDEDTARPQGPGDARGADRPLGGAP
jgi:NitT/TauT family transport system ATP-binding protein